MLTCFKHHEDDKRPRTMTDDKHMDDRCLCLKQDIWSNGAQVILLFLFKKYLLTHVLKDVVLGNIISEITLLPTWKIFTAALGVTPFDKAHTAKNTLHLTELLLSEYGLTFTV